MTYTCPKPLPELPSVIVGGQVKPMQQASPSRYQHRDIKSHVTLKGDVRTMGERGQKVLPRGPLIHASVPACHFSSDPAKEQAPSSNCPLNTFHLIPRHTFLAPQASLLPKHKFHQQTFPPPCTLQSKSSSMKTGRYTLIQLSSSGHLYNPDSCASKVLYP